MRIVTDSDGARLIRIAREAVRREIEGGGRAGRAPRVETVGAIGGVFVTLHADGVLRGCIGYLGQPADLAAVVARAAVSAATADPRFEPVTAGQLDELSYRLSLLGPPTPLTDADGFVLGRDGVIVERAGHRGLLLPQVALERRWDRQRLFSEACLKAGLSADSWREPGTSVRRFECQELAEP